MTQIITNLSSDMKVLGVYVNNNRRKLATNAGGTESMLYKIELLDSPITLGQRSSPI